MLQRARVGYSSAFILVFLLLVFGSGARSETIIKGDVDAIQFAKHLGCTEAEEYVMGPEILSNSFFARWESPINLVPLSNGAIYAGNLQLQPDFSIAKVLFPYDRNSQFAYDISTSKYYCFDPVTARLTGVSFSTTTSAETTIECKHFVSSFEEKHMQQFNAQIYNKKHKYELYGVGGGDAYIRVGSAFLRIDIEKLKGDILPFTIIRNFEPQLSPRQNSFFVMHWFCRFVSSSVRISYEKGRYTWKEFHSDFAGESPGGNSWATPHIMPSISVVSIESVVREDGSTDQKLSKEPTLTYTPYFLVTSRRRNKEMTEKVVPEWVARTPESDFDHVFYSIRLTDQTAYTFCVNKEKEAFIHGHFLFDDQITPHDEATMPEKYFAEPHFPASEIVEGKIVLKTPAYSTTGMPFGSFSRFRVLDLNKMEFTNSDYHPHKGRFVLASNNGNILLGTSSVLKLFSTNGELIELLKAEAGQSFLAAVRNPSNGNMVVLVDSRNGCEYFILGDSAQGNNTMESAPFAKPIVEDGVITGVVNSQRVTLKYIDGWKIHSPDGSFAKAVLEDMRYVDTCDGKYYYYSAGRYATIESGTGKRVDFKLRDDFHILVAVPCPGLLIIRTGDSENRSYEIESVSERFESAKLLLLNKAQILPISLNINCVYLAFSEKKTFAGCRIDLDSCKISVRDREIFCDINSEMYIAKDVTGALYLRKWVNQNIPTELISFEKIIGERKEGERE